MYVCIYIYIYIHTYSNILHVCVLDAIRILLSRGEIPEHTGSSSGNSTKRISACKLLPESMAVGTTTTTTTTATTTTSTNNNDNNNNGNNNTTPATTTNDNNNNDNNNNNNTQAQ